MELEPSERRCLTLAAHGFTAGEIAIATGWPYETVKKQLESARHKLGARSLAQAVALARGVGFEAPKSRKENPMEEKPVFDRQAADEALMRSTVGALAPLATEIHWPTPADDDDEGPPAPGEGDDLPNPEADMEC